MSLNQSVVSWAQSEGFLKNAKLSVKLENSDCATKRRLPFIGIGTGTDIRHYGLECGPLYKLLRDLQPTQTSSRLRWNLVHCSSAAKGLTSTGTGAPSFHFTSSKVPKHASWYFSSSQRPNCAGPLIPRSSHQRVSAIQQDNVSVSIDIDWQSRALKFLTYTSVPFLLYALAFASGYEPFIQSLTAGSWDKAPDAGQQIFDNFPLWCLHSSCASLYVCSTLLQFIFPGGPKRHASLHRASGYVFLMCGGLLSVTGLIMAPKSEFPGFVPPCLALSFLWLVCGGMALWSIKRRLVKEHEKWMVRTTAAGYASILSRPAIVFVHCLTGNTYRASGTPGLWLAILVAMTSSELLLKHLELQNAISRKSRDRA